VQYWGLGLKGEGRALRTSSERFVGQGSAALSGEHVDGTGGHQGFAAAGSRHDDVFSIVDIGAGGGAEGSPEPMNV